MSIENNNVNEQRLFFKALAFVLLIRLIISVCLPITGDEAYFISWGKHLDYGYYDHTPFVGWLLAAFLTISDAGWWLRLPAVLLPIILSYGIYRIVQINNPKVAMWVALSFLVAPLNIINVLITTDTPVIFFSFISAWFFYRALYETKPGKNYNVIFLLSGLFLGLAFFSKYFAVLLGIAYGLYIVFFYRNRKGFVGLGLMFLAVLPFAGINILWNYNNCWNNILFNLINRTTGSTDILSNFYKYIIMMIYVLSPVLIYYFIKNLKKYNQCVEKNITHLYIWLAGLPLILFLLLIFRKEIGLHWILSFYPFVFIAFSSFLSVKEWRITFYFMFVMSLLHLLLISIILTVPLKSFISDKILLQNYAFGTNPDKFLTKLKEYEEDYIFSTVSYGMAAVASYHSNKRFIVFSEGSFHARGDDEVTNYKELDGKNILLFKRTANYLDVYENYFVSSERKNIEVDGVVFELLLGNGFKYELYRKEILAQINRDYYTMPDWLPLGSCGFKEKYGLD